MMRKRRASDRWRGIAGASLLILMIPEGGHTGEAPIVPDPSIDTRFEAAEADGDLPRRRLISWNEYEGPWFTARFGGGFLYDFAAYEQSEASEAQMPLDPKVDLRDFRILLKGQLKFVPNLTYTVGYMYDKAKTDWRFRQTGLMLAVPSLHGGFFVGRTKEGFSTSKIMVGYQGWTNERAAINDSLLPILADGIKWTGTIPGGKLVYNIGYYNDWLSEVESFNKNDEQVVVRTVWLPYAGMNRGVLHLAAQGRFAAANDGFLQYRSKPESFEAQTFAIDTGKFAANGSTTLGLEFYWRPGAFMMGSEYFFNWVSSEETGNPLFHGGEVFVAYVATGEIRPYNAKGAYFDRISPTRTAFEGGIGAWELVLRYSYADLDSGTITGGTFQRITPMVNWHLSDNVRLEFVTGYGVLDRFDTRQGTVFRQGRIQLQL
jgi:phosphate-selective porin OprO/OprP